MHTEISLSDALGKTLSAVECSISGQCVLVFTDNTFTTLEAMSGYDSGDTWIEKGRLDIFDFGHNAIVRSGIVTREELNAMIEARNDKICAQRLANERKQYERLKKQFENS